MAKTANQRTNPLLCVTSVFVGRTVLSVPVLHFKYSLDSELVLETMPLPTQDENNKLDSMSASGDFL